MRLVLVDGPETEPLTAEEVKARLGIGADLADTTVEAFIMAARQQIEGPTGMGLALNTQSWDGALDGFPCDNGRIDIPLLPLQSVEFINYRDSSGALVGLDPDDYQVVPGQRPFIIPVPGGSWPATTSGGDAVSVRFIAGFGDDPEDVPEPIRMAICMIVSHLRSLSAQNLFISQDTTEGVGSKSYVVGGNAQAAIDGVVKSLLSGYRIMSV